MLRTTFIANAFAGAHGPEQRRFADFEMALRGIFIETLAAAIARQTAPSAAAVEFDRGCKIVVLNDLAAGLFNAGQARLAHEWDAMMPLAEAHTGDRFQEALVRLTGRDGQAVRPDALFDALDDPAFGADLGPAFRAWLFVAQIRAFRESGQTAALSLNIRAGDLVLEDVRTTLEQSMALARDAFYGPLVLEATEHAPWSAPSIAFLADLAARHDAKIAVDDYGAAKGYNDRATLAAFARAVRPGDLIVKLDGPAVTAFLDGDHSALPGLLTDVQAICPQAPVVAEWISTAEEARRLNDQLAGYGLRHAVALIQSSYLPDTEPAAFLAALRGGPAQLAGPGF